ncbi:MAG: hypothetical protein ACRC0V_12240 [Fusobacteriaceae bacterium]
MREKKFGKECEQKNYEKKVTGFVLLEFVISLAIISVLLFPLLNLTQTFVRLVNRENRMDFLDDQKLTELEAKGYTQILMESPENFQIIQIENLGLVSEPYRKPIILLQEKNEKKIINKILTELSVFKECF